MQIFGLNFSVFFTTFFVALMMMASNVGLRKQFYRRTKSEHYLFWFKFSNLLAKKL